MPADAAPTTPATSASPSATAEGEARRADAASDRERRPSGWTARYGDAVPWLVLAAVAVALVAIYGLQPVAQTTLNGLSFGAVIAIGAVGLTLVYSILKLVNFAHGDFLTLGAYMAMLAGTAWGLPLPLGALFAMAVTAAVAMSLEVTIWRPMRRRRSGLLQLLLISLGIALIIRAAIQFAFGSQLHTLDVNVTDAYSFLGLTLGHTEAVVMTVGVVTLVALALGLRYSLLGRRMRALADNLELAETTGINTPRVILWTWVIGGGLAGLAGILAGARSSISPEFGFQLLLPMFAAVVMGGIGNVFGALVAGLVLAVGIEWSTLAIGPQWKIPVGFGILLLTLAVRPQGIFGTARTI